MTTSNTTHWPLSIVSAITSLINMLLPILLVRILPPVAIGDYKIFFLYLSLVPAFTFVSGLISNVPYWSGQTKRSLESLRASFQLVLIAAVLGTLLGVLFASSLQEAFSWSSSEALLFACAIFGTVAHQFIEDCLITQGRIWFSAFFGGAFEIIKSLSLIGAAWWWQDTAAVFAAYSLVVGLKVFVAILIGVRDGLLSFVFERAALLEVGKRAAPISAAALFGIFIDKADQFILSHSLNVAEFATYSLGCLVVPPLLSLEASIMRVCIPSLAKSLSKNDFGAAARQHSYAVEQISLFILPATAGLIVFAEPIVSLLFTDQYQSAAGFLQVFALSYLILIIPFDASARAIGASRWMFRSFIFFSVLCLVSAGFGSKLAGAYGALTATIVAKTLMRLYGLHFSKRTLKCSLSQLLPISSLLIEAALVLLLSLMSLTVEPLFASSLMWLLVCGSSFAAIYLPIALLLRNRAALRMNSQPNILILAQTLQIGGLEKMVVSLCTSLALRSDINVQLLVYDQPKEKDIRLLSSQLSLNNIKLTELHKSPGFSFRTLAKILQIVLTERITTIHSHNIGPLLYASLARVLSLGAFKLIHTNHGFTELEKYPRYRWYEWACAKLSTTTVAVSQEVFDNYRELGVEATSLIQIPNGVISSGKRIEDQSQKMEARLRLVKSIGNNQLKQAHCEYTWILSVARLHPIKGHDKMIALWSQLPAELKAKTCLIIVGPESDKVHAESLRNLTRDLEFGSQVAFIGSSQDPQPWFQVADIYLSTSLKEGMPLAPVEALMAGVPLALSDIPGHHFLIGHATLISSNNNNDAAFELVKLLERITKPDFKEDQVISRAWALEQFSHSAMVDRYCALY